MNTIRETLRIAIALSFTLAITALAAPLGGYADPKAAEEEKKTQKVVSKLIAGSTSPTSAMGLRSKAYKAGADANVTVPPPKAQEIHIKGAEEQDPRLARCPKCTAMKGTNTCQDKRTGKCGNCVLVRNYRVCLGNYKLIIVAGGSI